MTSDPTTTAPPPPPTLVAQPDNATLLTDSHAYVDVLANDTCNGVTPCTVANMAPPPATKMTATAPAGWTVAITSTGLIRVDVPPDITAGTRTVTYTITDPATAQPATGILRVRVRLQPTPQRFNPPQGTKFSHAFVPGSSYQIHSQILRSINSTPKGAQIKILSWSFSSPSLRAALVAAKNRGVSVQIILAGRSNVTNSDWGFLVTNFGMKRNLKSVTTGSWVFRCTRSCRGTQGTMHAKVYIFSQVYNTLWVTMTGSGNMTDFAAVGQWNQMFTNTNNKPAYDALYNVFQQAKKDVPATPQQLTIKLPTTTFFFAPLTTNTATADFMNKALNTVRCTGNTSFANGRTRIRIAMYTWRDSRGTWLARTVRRLWDQGCDVRIIYSIMSGGLKQILYSPAGRGRIPMRQTLLVDKLHQPIWYLHNKYVAIEGNIGGVPNSYVAYQGSFNFSNLGLTSDENFQRLPGATWTTPYFADFDQVWHQPETRAPNPFNYVAPEDRIVLGTGVYKYMEPN
ncbi:MAG: hypothetical protein JWR52_1955 [Marmoricola sp.]|nr:hypothetical protein [Marmoricola sp.]